VTELLNGFCHFQSLYHLVSPLVLFSCSGWRFERVQLGKGWEIVDSLMRGFYGMVSPRLEFVAVGSIFEVTIVLVARGGAEE
jgi:hypothetical protein